MKDKSLQNISDTSKWQVPRYPVVEYFTLWFSTLILIY